MNMRDLVPWRRSDESGALASQQPSQQDSLSPFLSLHREMNRLFDDAFRGFDFGRRSSWPSMDVEETDREYRVTVEAPGVDEKDLEVVMADGVLTVRGEKRDERSENAHGRAFSERYFGRFERRVMLDRDIDPDKIRADFRNGVLTVTAPKSVQAVERTKRIPINGPSGTAH